MKEFECPDPRLTCKRVAVEAFLAAFGPYKSRGERVLARHLGVTALDENGASELPMAAYMRAMRELQEQLGTPFMRRVGSFIFDKAVFPPGIDSLRSGMETLNIAYHMNHSAAAAGRIGGYHWTPTGSRAGAMRLDNPYPCAMDLGIVETIARRFEPTSTVVHEPDACRHEGADACVYRVTW